MDASVDLRLKLSIFCLIALAFKSTFARDPDVFAPILAWLKEVLA